MIGNIPKNLKLFIRQEETVKWRWEDVEDGQRETKVRPAYISDADNAKTCLTGKTWAESKQWDYTSSKYVDSKATTISVPNKPFSGLKIITLEIRDKGGRAYKVAADIGGVSNVYFDMREDVLLDCLFNGNLMKDGLVAGDFIFARVGSQMKPVRVGSLLHNKMIEATKIDSAEACKLKVGGIYESKNGDRAIYLGEYWTWDITKPKRAYSYSGGQYIYDTSTIRIGKPIKVHVFNADKSIKYLAPTLVSKDGEYDVWFFLKDVSETSYGIHVNNPPKLRHKKGDVTVYDLQMTKSHSYKKEIGTVEVPKDYVQTVVDQFSQKTGAPYVNLAQVEHGKLLCLSKDRGYIHPLMQPYVGK
jgi:hypothetical protein